MRAALSRREWLQTATAATALAPAAMAAPAESRLLGQAYVYQQQAQREKKALLSMVPEIFASIRKAGYRGVEITDAFFTPDTREATVAALKEHGIALRIAYIGLVLHEPGDALKKAQDNFESYLQTVKPLGVRAINSNPIPKPKGAAKTDEELARQAGMLNRLGGIASKAGVQFYVHHHEPEMRDNAREWRHILKNTDPKLVSLCIDVDWVVQGGQDPVKLLAEAGKRVASLHLRNAKDKVWLESLAPGDVDYPAVARQLDASKVRPWLVAELAYAARTEVTRSIEENLRLSREYAEKIFRVKA